MLLFHCTLLGESLSVSSIMFRRILSLSLVHILHAHFTLTRCSSLIVSGLRKPLAHGRPGDSTAVTWEMGKSGFRQTELNANVCRKGWMLERKRTPKKVTWWSLQRRRMVLLWWCCWEEFREGLSLYMWKGAMIREKHSGKRGLSWGLYCLWRGIILGT